MHYGHPPHIPSPGALTFLKCENHKPSPCGWFGPYTEEERDAKGVPWYCDNCGGKVYHWVRYHPSEEANARAVMEHIG